MKKTPTPGIGCFTASYPSAVWQQVTCTVAPNVPYPPANGAQPQTVGNGTDFSAIAASGILSSAEGSFPSVSGLTSANSYSLQVNAQRFNDPPACSGAANPSQCQGWQQFIYSQSASQVFMEYWLLNYGNACPGGWTTYQSVNCYKNSSAVGATEPVANLPYVSLSGSATGGTDEAMLEDGLTEQLYTISASDGLLDLESYWNTAEFNVFGDCCSNQVNFNSGTTFVVQTSVDNGTTNAPTYAEEGFTGETNNLNLEPQPGPVSCPYGGTSPGIQFEESNVSGTTVTCGADGVTMPVAQPQISGASSGEILNNGIPIGEWVQIDFTDLTPGATMQYMARSWDIHGQPTGSSCSTIQSGIDSLEVQCNDYPEEGAGYPATTQLHVWATLNGFNSIMLVTGT